VKDGTQGVGIGSVRIASDNPFISKLCFDIHDFFSPVLAGIA
jgi:hypothetical protein